MSQPKTFNGDQKIKLVQIINEGMQVMHEIDTLQGGLNDTIKAVAEELEVKPAILKKAVKLAHKASFGQVIHNTVHILYVFYRYDIIPIVSD